jgi:GDP-L-fucose synthase
MCRVVITGGTGFLGRYVTQECHKHDEFTHIMPLGSKDYDLRHSEDIKKMFYDCCPDVIIHLAAQVGGIGLNKAEPARLFYDNAIMGIELLHHAWMGEVKKLVNVGTVCAYPKYTRTPFKESDIWNGYPEETNAPYGLAKKMLLVQGQAYREQYGFNSIYLLPTNLYGPGDNFEPNSSHVIPALIKKIYDAIKQGRDAVEVWGTGEASRDFLYVEDCAKGIVEATLKYESGDPVNLGSGKTMRISTLVYTIAELMHYNGSIVFNADKPEGQPARCLNTSRAKTFGFEATTDIHTGLEKTILYYLRRI